METLTLSNNIEEIPLLAEFVESICEQAGLDMGITMNINLALEEAVVNVMNYAYPLGTQGKIVIEAMADDQRVKFVIVDQGAPFDPTTKEDVDTTLSVDDRPTGGLGIHLIRQIMDTINYERKGKDNVLTLCKKLV